MATARERLLEIDKNWSVNPNNIGLAELEEATRLLVSEYAREASQELPPNNKPKEAPMSLEAIKSTLMTAVSDAFDQAKVQIAEDAKAAQTPVDPAQPAPTPVDVDQLTKDAFQAGVVEENRRVLSIVQDAIGSHESTDEKLKTDLKLA